MKGNLIKILLLGLLSSVVYLFDDYKTLGTFYFYFLIAFLLFDIVRKKTISLLNVWNVAFLFIILSEVFSSKFSITNYSLPALKYLITANNFIFIGYLSNIKKSKSTIKRTNETTMKISRIAPAIIIIMVAFYFLMRINTALLAFALGRNTEAGVGDGFFLSAVLSSLGLILPALIAYYFIFVRKTKVFVPLIIASPVFFILFLGGTRFPLLFSILGFTIVAQSKLFKKMNMKKYLILGSTLVLLFVASILMKHNRSATTKDTELSILKSTGEIMSFPELFAENASPEGVLDMTSLMFQYFETHEHTYGASTSFILYFWVPRQLWPNKPTMLGYWLIREFRGGFGVGHSASFGFTGDLYADFGMFSLLFVLLLGFFLKRAEEFKDWALKSEGYVTIMGSMFFPYVFFFVRSPITSTMTFLGILFYYFLFKRIIFVKRIK